MLVYLFTDVAAGPNELRPLLRRTCDQTFNCISVDGDTSTNDTVLLLASGQSEVRLQDRGVRKKFGAVLLEVCQSLAGQIVRDGEGVQHVIGLSIEQASSRAEALRVAKAIAHSLLVKTAWAGADPNWGRILAAVGSCGVPIHPEKVEIMIGAQLVFRNGAAHPFDETSAHRDLAQPSCDIRVRLQRGRSAVLFHTTDLTAEYVRINADYST
jgi:glutamate N-acetyltransferase/amino-acid N-acetyltransferase